MKALISLVLAVVLIGGIYLVSTSGCEARARVAGDKIMDKIDNWLGELDVKRKKITIEVDKLTKRIEGVRVGKISAEVRLEEYQKRIDPLTAKIARVKEALGVLSPHLQATEDVQINGKTMSPQKIKDMANQLADEYELLNQKVGGLAVSVQAFQQSFDSLSRQYDMAKTSMKSMQSKLEQIDAKKESLDAMKDAQSILGTDGSISDKFTDLEKEINDLFVDVETGMRIESEKLSDREAAMESSSSAVDEVLESADQTQSRIDAILGQSDDGELKED